MGLRKGKCYSNTTRAYTRKSKFKQQSFIKTIPQLKIVRFDMGDPKREYDYQVNLISKIQGQVRQNAIEAARQVVNRRFTNKLGNIGYHLQIRKYPHHILRENKMLTGAHADRMQTGMQRSFGTPIGLSAQFRKGSPLFTAFVDKKDLEFAKKTLLTAAPRLPLKWSISISKLK